MNFIFRIGFLAQRLIFVQAKIGALNQGPVLVADDEKHWKAWN